MYRYLLTIIFSVLLMGVCSGKSGERAYVQTDKQLYLPGELIWLKMYVTDEAGKPDPVSKIGYIELTDEKNALLQAKVDLRRGVGEGWLELPKEIPSGNYRIVAYTNYMKNEGEKVFFDRVISVVNPYQKDNTVGVVAGSPEKEIQQERAQPVNNLLLSTDKSGYGNRESGVVTISGIPANIHSLGISIAGTDMNTGLPEMDLQAWTNALPEITSSSFSGDFLAEYEGHILKGKIIDMNNENAAVEYGVVPMVGFIGNNIRLFTGQVKNMSDVTVYTKDITGSHEIATTVLSFSSSNKYRLDIASPYYEHSAKPLPQLELNPGWEEKMVQRAVGVQTQQVYLEDSITKSAVPVPYFQREPDWTYILDEWTRFTTMREVVIEFILPLRFRSQGGQRVLSVLNEDRNGFSQGNSLVLLDGVPIKDHTSIYEYDPLKVERVNIYRGQFVFGGQLFDGVASFLTYKNDYSGLKVESGTQFFDYEGTKNKRYFYAPDYSNSSREYKRLPDYRHTLLWNTEIPVTNEGTAEVRFNTSDLSGEYRIVVEGITEDGKSVRAVRVIEVK